MRTGFDRARRRKKESVDGKETERIVDGLGLLGAVVFSPSDVNLVNGGPRLRRRFLDMALSLDGVVYTGRETYRLTDRVLAVPWHVVI